MTMTHRSAQLVLGQRLDGEDRVEVLEDQVADLAAHLQEQSGVIRTLVETVTALMQVASTYPVTQRDTKERQEALCADIVRTMPLPPGYYVDRNPVTGPRLIAPFVQ